MDDHTTDDRPLILTLLLDEIAQSTLDALRTAHFPAGRNHLAAHLTLFHNLPGTEIEAIRADLDEVTRAFGRIAMVAKRPIALGKGVAVQLDAPGLHTVRAELRRRWEPWLSPQDLQRHRPHVTIQNKVAPEQARALHRELAATFAPFPVTGIGLGLWRYLGGPWAPVARYPFTDSPTYDDPAYPNDPIL